VRDFAVREQTVAPEHRHSNRYLHKRLRCHKHAELRVTVAGSSSSSGGGTSSSSSGGGSCRTSRQGQSGNPDTTGAYCSACRWREWLGRFEPRRSTISVTVNGAGTAVTSPGAPLPSKGANDYYHFNISAGGVPWASVYWW
jgi:hypothetical protein